MEELGQSLGATLLWVSVFFLLTAVFNRTLGESLFSGSGFLFSYPLFSFYQVIQVKFLDIIHLLNSWTVTIIYILAVAGLLFCLSGMKEKTSLQNPPKQEEPHELLLKRIVWWPIGFILIIMAISSLITPINFYDDNTYHMPMVANYFQNESLASWATQCLRQIIRPYAVELQMLNLAFLSKSDTWMEFPNLLAVLVSLVAVYKIAQLVFSRKDLSLLCVAVLLTARQVLLTPTTAANDAPFMAFILCSFYWLIRTVIDSAANAFQGQFPRHPGISRIIPVLFLSLSVTLAVASKVVGVCLFAAVAIVLVLLVLLRRLSPLILIRFSVPGLAFILILVGDVFWRNFSQQVIFFGLTPNEYGAAGESANIIAIAKFYIYEICVNRLLMPQTMPYGSSHFGYLYPFLFLLGSVKVIQQLLTSKRMSNPGLWVLSISSIVLFFMVTIYRKPNNADLRFMIWLVPCFSILAISFLQKWKPIAVMAAISFCSALALSSFFQAYTTSSFPNITGLSIRYFIDHHKPPRLSDLFAQGDKKLLYNRLQAPMRGYNVLEEKARDDDWILYIGYEKSWMYPAWGGRFTRIVHGVHDLEDAVDKIKSRKYRFIILEQRADQLLRDGAFAVVMRSGYRELVMTRVRIIVERIPQPG